MGPFAALERFFERVFERPSARLFRARLQPIQLQRRVERAMESGRLSAADKVVVPNRYLVRLAPADLDAFGDLADSLELELADAALRFARAHRYTLSDRPAVRLVSDRTVAAGAVRVESSFSGGAFPAAADGGVPPGGAPGARGTAAGAGIRAAGRPRGAPAAGSAAGSPAGVGGPVADAPPAGAAAVDVNRTIVFDIPSVDAPMAVLREVAPDGRRRELALDGGPVTIGRGTENRIVIRDTRVSRYHGRLTVRQGMLVYTDLGSTNGTRVNGVEVDEVVLGAGDRIEIGDTVLVVESVAGG